MNCTVVDAVVQQFKDPNLFSAGILECTIGCFPRFKVLALEHTEALTNQLVFSKRDRLILQVRHAIAVQTAHAERLIFPRSLHTSEPTANDEYVVVEAGYVGIRVEVGYPDDPEFALVILEQREVVSKPIKKNKPYAIYELTHAFISMHAPSFTIAVNKI